MKSLIEKYKDNLPEAYLDFISRNESFQGDLGNDFGYVRLWNIKELQESWEGYKFQENLGDEWFPIGSNLGGEIIAIKTSSLTKEIFYIPFIPMSDKHAKPYCDSFSKLYDVIKLYFE